MTPTKSKAKPSPAKKATADSPFSVGSEVLIRTVTLYYTGRITTITDETVELEEAAWIADTGRFSTALQTGSLNEVEPYPGTVVVFLSAIVDMTAWIHGLPTTVR